MPAVAAFAQAPQPAAAARLEQPAEPATLASAAIPPPMAVAQSMGYVLTPGDLLEVSVYGVPELSQRTRISAQGEVYLPLVSHVELAGLTVEQAQSAIERSLIAGHFMTNPHVNLSVAEYSSGVTVIGEVQKPGIYPVITCKKLFNILSLAGGTTATAGRTVMISRRDTPEAHQLVTLSNDPDKALVANVDVYQGDTVLVTKAGVVYAVGEVVSPSGFIMDDKTDYTVLKVLAMAHGPTKTASTSHAKVVRKTPQGLKEIDINLKKITEAKSPDVGLQAEDILFVPTSKGKIVEYQSLNTIVSLSGAVGILGIERGIP